jgi:hypothetical protein
METCRIYIGRRTLKLLAIRGGRKMLAATLHVEGIVQINTRGILSRA